MRSTADKQTLAHVVRQQGVDIDITADFTEARFDQIPLEFVCQELREGLSEDDPNEERVHFGVTGIHAYTNRNGIPDGYMLIGMDSLNMLMRVIYSTKISPVIRQEAMEAYLSIIRCKEHATCQCAMEHIERMAKLVEDRTDLMKYIPAWFCYLAGESDHNRDIIVDRVPGDVWEILAATPETSRSGLLVLMQLCKTMKEEDSTFAELALKMFKRSLPIEPIATYAMLGLAMWVEHVPQNCDWIAQVRDPDVYSALSAFLQADDPDYAIQAMRFIEQVFKRDEFFEIDPYALVRWLEITEFEEILIKACLHAALALSQILRYEPLLLNCVERDVIPLLINRCDTYPSQVRDVVCVCLATIAERAPTSAKILIVENGGGPVLCEFLSSADFHTVAHALYAIDHLLQATGGADEANEFFQGLQDDSIMEQLWDLRECEDEDVRNLTENLLRSMQVIV